MQAIGTAVSKQRQLIYGVHPKYGVILRLLIIPIFSTVLNEVHYTTHSTCVLIVYFFVSAKNVPSLQMSDEPDLLTLKYKIFNE